MLNHFFARVRVDEKPIGGRCLSQSLPCLLTLAVITALLAPVGSTVALAAAGGGVPAGVVPEREAVGGAVSAAASIEQETVREPVSAAVLTEREAVRRALSRPALTDVAEGEAGVARAQAIGETLWPDPELSYDREETSGDQGAAQDFVMISQRFDLSGARRLRSDAAGHRARAVAYGGDMRLLETEAEVRLRFHELLLAQLRVDAIGDWVARIEGALAIVRRREDAGDASAYDRRRLQREAANAASRLGVERAGSDRAWAALAALIAEPGADAGCPPRLSGRLVPDSLESPGLVLSRVETRPDIMAARAHVEAAEADGEAAARWWVPGTEFGVGWTGLDAGDDSADGYLAMAKLTLPLFARNRDEVLAAASRARLARGRTELTLARARWELAGRASELERLLEAARRFREEAVAGTEALIKSAEAGYAGDELRIIELLDAYRGGYQDEMTVLEREFAARHARIEFHLFDRRKYSFKPFLSR